MQKVERELPCFVEHPCTIELLAAKPHVKLRYYPPVIFLLTGCPLGQTGGLEIPGILFGWPGPALYSFERCVCLNGFAAKCPTPFMHLW